MRVLLAAAGALALFVGLPAFADNGSDFRIVNDPAGLDWEYYGGGYKLKPIRDPSFPGGAAVEIEVQKGHDPWSAGTNIRLIEPIVTGHNYVIRFWARTLSAASSDGKGRILVRFFRNSDPYPGFGDTLVEIGPDWRAYEVSGKATIDSPVDKAAVGMQLASVGQTIQLGQAVVAEGATTLEGRALKIAGPDPIPPASIGNIMAAVTS